MLRDFFIKYLELQQGEDYVEDENYYNMGIDNLVLLEENHFNDFLEELKNIIKEGGLK